MEILIDCDYQVTVMMNHINAISSGMKEEATTDEITNGATVNILEDTGSVKDPFLSDWTAVIGISATTIIIAIIIGFLLAKKKIKKGYDLYED